MTSTQSHGDSAFDTAAFLLSLTELEAEIQRAVFSIRERSITCLEESLLRQTHLASQAHDLLSCCTSDSLQAISPVTLEAARALFRTTQTYVRLVEQASHTGRQLLSLRAGVLPHDKSYFSRPSSCSVEA